MSGFVESQIESVRAHPADFSWSPDEYRVLFERIEREAQAVEEEFRKQAHARAWELAKRQGVKPIRSFDELPRDPSPEEDSVDEFLSWIYALRHQDKDWGILE